MSSDEPLAAAAPDGEAAEPAGVALEAGTIPKSAATVSRPPKALLRDMPITSSGKDGRSVGKGGRSSWPRGGDRTSARLLGANVCGHPRDGGNVHADRGIFLLATWTPARRRPGQPARRRGAPS